MFLEKGSSEPGPGDRAGACSFPSQGWTQLSFWGTRPPTGETSEGKYPAELRPGQETRAARAAAPVSLGLRASWLHSSRGTPYKPSSPHRGPPQPSPSPRSACPPGRRPLGMCGSPDAFPEPRGVSTSPAGRLAPGSVAWGWPLTSLILSPHRKVAPKDARWQGCRED